MEEKVRKTIKQIEELFGLEFSQGDEDKR